MRPAHILRGNKSREQWRHLILYDVEARRSPAGPSRERHVVVLIVAVEWVRRNGRPDTLSWRYFGDVGEFWSWVTSRCYARTKLILSAHNLNYDLQVARAFTELPRRGYRLRSYYCKGTTTLVSFAADRRRIECIDSTNFWPGALADLAGLAGLEKIACDTQTCSMEDLQAYCRRDVEILLGLWQRWIAFIQDNDLGMMRKTLSAQAFGAYRHRFMPHNIYIHNYEPALALERRAYHGGRVEVLRAGSYQGETFTKLDVNSMYPYVMYEHEYPTMLASYRESPDLLELDLALRRYHVLADVDIEIGEPLVPIDEGKATCYPTGRLRACLTTGEIREVLDRGQITRVHRMALYRSAPIFKGYITELAELKAAYDRSGEPAYRAICKGLMNYLYGKFGQAGLRDTIIGDCDPAEFRILPVVDADRGETYELIMAGGSVIRRDREGESYHSFPAICAEVTANARLYLARLIAIAGREHVWYVDTDSLIVDPEGHERLKHLIHPIRMGKLKVEGQSDRLMINAPKDYSLGDDVKIAGVRRNALKLAGSRYAQDKFPSIQGRLRSGDSGPYETERIVKRLQRRIRSGAVGPDGVVRPWQLAMWPVEPPGSPEIAS